MRRDTTTCVNPSTHILSIMGPRAHSRTSTFSVFSVSNRITIAITYGIEDRNTLPATRFVRTLVWIRRMQTSAFIRSWLGQRPRIDDAQHYICRCGYKNPYCATQGPPCHTIRENTCMDTSHANFRVHPIMAWPTSSN
jgi:hypothetical protein